MINRHQAFGRPKTSSQRSKYLNKQISHDMKRGCPNFELKFPIIHLVEFNSQDFAPVSVITSSMVLKTVDKTQYKLWSTALLVKALHPMQTKPTGDEENRDRNETQMKHRNEQVEMQRNWDRETWKLLFITQLKSTREKWCALKSPLTVENLTTGTETELNADGEGGVGGDGDKRC